MLSRFHLIPERHGQTDRQTDRRTELLYQYRASVCCRAIKTDTVRATTHATQTRSGSAYLYYVQHWPACSRPTCSTKLVSLLSAEIVFNGSIFSTPGSQRVLTRLTTSSAVAERPRDARVIEYFASHSRSLKMVPFESYMVFYSHSIATMAYL